MALLRNRQSRHSLERYNTGLLTDLPRKNCQTSAAAVANTTTEKLQHLLPDAVWDPSEVDEARVRLMSQHSTPDGVLILADTGLPKRDNASVGVSHQDSGTLGKQGGCQIVVTAEYVAPDVATQPPFHWPVTARLYLPESWASDPMRRQRTQVPPTVAVAPKTQLALQLVEQACAWQVPFTTVVADAGDGDAPSFLQALEGQGVPYVCAVASTCGVRLPAEIAQADLPATPTVPRGRGQPKKPRPAPRHTAEEVISALAEDQWRTVVWREGSRGPLRKQVAAVRTHWATSSARHSATHGRVRTGPQGWLIGERPVPGDTGDPKWFYSSLPADMPLDRLVQVAHLRWTIEQFYEDAKGECGLDEYQGRRWDGLHRHLALVMLAYCFLMLQASAPAAAFSPLSTPYEPARHPSPDPRLAFSGSRPLVDSYRPNPLVPPSSKLTK
jgi:SRSO17 transposase